MVLLLCIWPAHLATYRLSGEKIQIGYSTSSLVAYADGHVKHICHAHRRHVTPLHVDRRTQSCPRMSMQHLYCHGFSFILKGYCLRCSVFGLIREILYKCCDAAMFHVRDSNGRTPILCCVEAPAEEPAYLAVYLAADTAADTAAACLELLLQHGADPLDRVPSG